VSSRFLAETSYELGHTYFTFAPQLDNLTGNGVKSWYSWGNPTGRVIYITQGFRHSPDCCHCDSVLLSQTLGSPTQCNNKTFSNKMGHLPRPPPPHWTCSFMPPKTQVRLLLLLLLLAVRLDHGHTRGGAGDANG
jgi:hypothetical protein